MSKLKIVAALSTILVVTAFLIWRVCCSPLHKNEKLVVTAIEVEALAEAVHFYFQNSGKLPSNELGLKSLVQPYSDTIKRIPLDDWGREYKYYKFSETGFLIMSLGPTMQSEKVVIRSYKVSFENLEPVTNFELNT